MTAVNVGDLYRFQAQCAQLGIETPPPIDRGLHLLQVAAEHSKPPAIRVLDLEAAAARAHITDLAIRSHRFGGGLETGLGAGVEEFSAQVLLEIREAALPYLRPIVTGLQPRFEEQARPLVDAVQRYHFTSSTQSDQVIDMDQKAIVAWRAAKSARDAIQSIVAFRILISNAFTVSPTPAEVREHHWNQGIFEDAEPDRSRLNFSIAFAASDNWSLDAGYLLERQRRDRPMADIDWYALAAGGLRLNPPDEVREKLLARRKVTAAPMAVAG